MFGCWSCLGLGVVVFFILDCNSFDLVSLSFSFLFIMRLVFSMVIQTTLSSVRPGGGKGKGQPRAVFSAGVPANVYKKPPAYKRDPSPSRTDELCPDDWMSVAEREAELAELDEIIRLMEEQSDNS